MSTNRALRKRVRALVAAGISQKVIAAKLGKSESWVSRWLKAGDKSTSPVFTVDQMDRLYDYLRELGVLIQGVQPPDRPASAGTGFRQATGTTGPDPDER